MVFNSHLVNSSYPLEAHPPSKLSSARLGSAVLTDNFRTFLHSASICGSSLSGSGLKAKSLHISGAVSNFYGTKIEIWAGFGPFGSKKKLSQLWATFVAIFSCFHGHFFKYCSFALKCCIEWRWKKVLKNLEKSIMIFK